MHDFYTQYDTRQTLKFVLYLPIIQSLLCLPNHYAKRVFGCDLC